MKRTVTNFFIYIFLGFLVIGGICIVQNLFQEIEKTVYPKPTTTHVLAYPKC